MVLSYILISFPFPERKYDASAPIIWDPVMNPYIVDDGNQPLDHCFTACLQHLGCDTTDAGYLPGLKLLQSSCNLCSGDRCCWAVRVGFLCIVEVGVEVLVFRYRRLVEESWKVVMPPVNALLFDGEHVAISVFDKMAQLVGICFCLL